MVYSIPMSTQCLSIAALAVLLSAGAIGQTPVETSGSMPSEQIPIEVLTPPRLVGVPVPVWPYDLNGVQGWVDVGLMVDQTGKPFEVTVNASTGYSALVESAVEAMKTARYKPALLNGQPVESATEYRFVFNSGNSSSPRPRFTSRYLELQGAIKSKDRPRADQLMKRLDVASLSEDALFGMAMYSYAREWGDDAQQLAGLRRALANVDQPVVLQKELLFSLQVESFLLDFRLRYYAEAMALWAAIQTSGTEPSAIEKLRPIVQQIADIRLGHKAYDILGLMPDGSWQVRLYEPDFRINVGQGHLSQIKLRCAKGFVRFKFDPEFQYKVASKYGDCTMELVGDPGTSFTLTQS
jgi:TonB family protein